MSCCRWFIIATFVILSTGLISNGNDARADDLYDAEELEFLEIINKYRQDEGLEPLILSDALARASERHSEDMGRYTFFSHDTVKSSRSPVGSKPWDRMARSDYDYPDSHRAENLAAGYQTAEQAFKAWRASPGHNRNMLDAKQKVIGIARVRVSDSKYDWYWTTDFGSEVDPTAHAPGETPPSEKEQASKKEDEADEARDRNTDRDGVENGSMEQDVVWKQKSLGEEKSLIDEGVARLGGYDDAEDEISQKTRIQEGQKLTYRVWVLTEEEERLEDGLVVRLTDEDGEHLATVESHTDVDAGQGDEDGWIRDSVDLSGFAGKTVKLSFLAKTDGKRPTTFYVDDVTIE